MRGVHACLGVLGLSAAFSSGACGAIDGDGEGSDGVAGAGGAPTGGQDAGGGSAGDAPSGSGGSAGEAPLGSGGWAGGTPFGGGGFGGAPATCLPGFWDPDGPGDDDCVPCEAGEHCPGSGRSTCGAYFIPDEYDQLGLDGAGTWDHDTDPATACVEWRNCASFSEIGIGTATSDRRCWPIGWTLAGEVDFEEATTFEEIVHHPSGDVVAWADMLAVMDNHSAIWRVNAAGVIWEAEVVDASRVAVASGGDVVVIAGDASSPNLTRLDGETGGAVWAVTLTDVGEVMALGFDGDGQVVVTSLVGDVLEGTVIDFSSGDVLGDTEDLPGEDLSPEQRLLADTFQNDVLLPYFEVAQSWDAESEPDDITWTAVDGHLFGTCTRTWPGGPNFSTLSMRYIWRLAGSSPTQWVFQRVTDSFGAVAFLPDGTFVMVYNDFYVSAELRFYAALE